MNVRVVPLPCKRLNRMSVDQGNGFFLPPAAYMTFRRSEWEAAVDEYNKAEAEGKLEEYESQQAFYIKKQKRISDVSCQSLSLTVALTSLSSSDGN